ncbi:MAG: sigma-70 family RNA polymerase sigma factor [Bacillota bacterium]|nr:sigma-70 family RNA polymerase sigma factor [Bacillota bacterium]
MAEKDVIYTIERYKNTVFKVAFTYCKNRSDADDIFQEVFLRYFKKKPVFADEVHEKAWFIRVTINCCKKLFFSSWFKKTAPLDETIAFETMEESELFYSVMELPLKYRAVVHLFYYEDYSIKEIAELTNQKETTVSTQLQRARQLLRTKLKEELLYE